MSHDNKEPNNNSRDGVRGRILLEYALEKAKTPQEKIIAIDAEITDVFTQASANATDLKVDLRTFNNDRNDKLKKQEIAEWARTHLKKLLRLFDMRTSVIVNELSDNEREQYFLAKTKATEADLAILSIDDQNQAEEDVYRGEASNDQSNDLQKEQRIVAAAKTATDFTQQADQQVAVASAELGFTEKSDLTTATTSELKPIVALVMAEEGTGIAHVLQEGLQRLSHPPVVSIHERVQIGEMTSAIKENPGAETIFLCAHGTLGDTLDLKTKTIMQTVNSGDRVVTGSFVVTAQKIDYADTEEVRGIEVGYAPAKTGRIVLSDQQVTNYLKRATEVNPNLRAAIIMSCWSAPFTKRAMCDQNVNLDVAIAYNTPLPVSLAFGFAKSYGLAYALLGEQEAAMVAGVESLRAYFKDIAENKKLISRTQALKDQEKTMPAGANHTALLEKIAYLEAVQKTANTYAKATDNFILFRKRPVNDEDVEESTGVYK
ncbi:MAG: hypothetical protein WCW27_02020 [Patescibacteria group bacterium]|jgi:hypothetical protein